ncbi:MAG: hypothetical protein GX801_01395 [Fibrobacter sp.]|nr:hypothetical protein [Fibrobacter sp.]
MKNTAIIISSPTYSVKLLKKVLNELNTEQSFAFNFDILLNPDAETIKKYAQNSLCIFFVQTHNPSFSANTIQQMLMPYKKQGHQIILLANAMEDYLDLAIYYKVGNILFENEFDTPMVRALLQRLLGEDFFGHEPFFVEPYAVYEQQVVLAGAVNRSGLIDRLFPDYLKLLKDTPVRHRFHAHISELLTNAIAYGVLGISPEERDSNNFFMPKVVNIPTGKEIKVHILQDHEKYGISVKDRMGRLTLLRVLQKLRRHTKLPGQDAPDGIEDLTGRGLYIVSRQNRLIINILTDIQTEIILLSYFAEEKNRYKSLIVNEKIFASDENLKL